MLERITIGNGFDEVFAIMDESFPKTEYAQIGDSAVC